MMRMNFSARLLLVGCFTLPTAVLAAPLNLVTSTNQSVQSNVAEFQLKPSAKLPNAEAFCSAFPDTKAKLEAKVSAKEAAVTRYLDALPEVRENERNGRDAKIDEARSAADQRRSEWYARLADRADDKNEKGVVQKYQNQVEEAIENRRDAIDAAVLEFRTGADQLTMKRRVAMQEARDAFQTSVSVALGTLEINCQKGVRTEVIRSDFKASLERAKSNLTKDKKSIELMQGEMKKLESQHRASVAKALQTFGAEFTLANAALKQTFK